MKKIILFLFLSLSSLGVYSQIDGDIIVGNSTLNSDTISINVINKYIIVSPVMVMDMIKVWSLSGQNIKCVNVVSLGSVTMPFQFTGIYIITIERNGLVIRKKVLYVR